MFSQYDHLIKKYYIRFMEEHLNQYGLSGQGGFYLLEIDKRKIMKMNHLVDMTPYHKSHSTRIVSRLNDMKLINKEIDPEDNRGFLLSITDLGHTVADHVREVHLDWDKLTSNALTNDEAIQLNNIMMKTYLYLKNYFDEVKNEKNI